MTVTPGDQDKRATDENTIQISNPGLFETGDTISVEGHLWLFGAFASAAWKRRVNKFLFRIHWPIKREYFRVVEVKQQGDITMARIEPLTLLGKLWQRIRKSH